MRSVGVGTVTEGGWAQALVAVLVAVAGLAGGMMLLRASRRGADVAAARRLKLAGWLAAGGALVPGACLLAWWLGDAPSARIWGGAAGLAAAAGAAAFWLCRKDLADPLSPQDLRAVNQALRHELEMLRSQNAARARMQKMEALALLSGGVSHYVNNIMQVTGGALALLAPRVAGDGQAREMIALALTATDRGMQLTGQLLAFAQHPASMVKPVDMRLFIDHARNELAGQLPPGIAMTLGPWDADPMVPLLVDAGEIMQVLSNLVTNAREAMGGKGALSIDLATCHMCDRVDLADGYYLRLMVRDDGAGLAPHLAEQAMVPFVTSKPTGLAAGLGLSVVYGIARRAGGSAMLEAAPGQGTIATVYLRLALSEGGMEPVMSSLGQGDAGMVREDFEGLRVMLVDDEPETRTIVAMTLESLGCRVVQASGGEQALALVARSRPDLFILDYAMPGMNGAELAGALRAMDGACRIAFLTGFADRVAIEAVLGPEVILVFKPASRLQLARAIADALA
jgi:signal transduction histidine kinase/CheY-like chemotaxis protein